MRRSFCVLKTGSSTACSQRGITEPSEWSSTARGLPKCIPDAWPHVLAPDLTRSSLSTVPATMSTHSRTLRDEAGSGSLETFDPSHLRECAWGVVARATEGARAQRPHVAGVKHSARSSHG